MSLETGKVDALACTCDLAKGYASANEDLVKADAEFEDVYKRQVSNTTVNGYTFNSYGVWVK